MSKFIKHVGVDGKGNKCIVVFRELPGDSSSALVVFTSALPANYHDDLLFAVESGTAQDLLDLGDFLFRQSFRDGTNMLNMLHQRGWLTKVSTKAIVMVPRPGVEINLAELNSQLATINSKSAAQGRTAGTVTESAGPPGVLSDTALAKRLRAQANTFEAEAKRLRKEADELDPQAVPATQLSVVDAEQTVEKKPKPKAAKKTAAAPRSSL